MAQDAENVVGLVATPSTVNLGPGDKAETVLVLSNGTDDEIADARIDVVNDPAVEATLLPPDQPQGSRALPPLPGGGSMAITVELGTTAGARIGGSVHFLLSYNSFVGGTDGRTVPHVTATTVTVTERAAASVSDLIQVTLHSSLATLTDKRSGDIFVQITNVSTEEMTVLEVTGSSPPFILLCAQPLEDMETPKRKRGCPKGTVGPQILPNRVLQPREAIAYKFTAVPVPANGFYPGKQTLVFKVRINPSIPNVGAGAAFATREIDVAVFGESQILSLLNLTSFYFLPGFLILVAMRILFKYVKEDEKGWLDPAKPDFYFLVISLSLLWLVIYLVVTSVFGSRRDLIAGYTSDDLMGVWFGAILVGVVAFVLAQLPLGRWLHKGREGVRRHKAQKRTVERDQDVSH